MWRRCQQYRQAEAAQGQMRYAHNLCEQIFTMPLSAKPPNWPHWDHMIENSFELFTSWAIAGNPNLANWTVVRNPRDRIISLGSHFPLVAVLEAKVFYRTPLNCLPDPLTFSLRSAEGWQFIGSAVSGPNALCCHGPSNALFCSRHPQGSYTFLVGSKRGTSLRWLWSIKMAQAILTKQNSENSSESWASLVSQLVESTVMQEGLVRCRRAWFDA